MKKAMSREEVALLVDLISENTIIVSQEINAYTNKIKEEAWTKLSESFNAKCGGCPRTKEQLKRKWDNLKKAARKRTQPLRMNHLKTGGGIDHIPPDIKLEKVSGFLDSTCVGFRVPFGGDGIGIAALRDDDGADIMNCDVIVDAPLPVAGPSGDMQVVESIALEYIKSEVPSSPKTKDIKYFGTHIPRQLISKKGKNNENSKQKSNVKRNETVTKYYEKKIEKLDLEIKLLQFQVAEREKGCKK